MKILQLLEQMQAVALTQTCPVSSSIGDPTKRAKSAPQINTKTKLWLSKDSFLKLWGRR